MQNKRTINDGMANWIHKRPGEKQLAYENNCDWKTGQIFLQGKKASFQSAKSLLVEAFKGVKFHHGSDPTSHKIPSPKKWNMLTFHITKPGKIKLVYTPDN